jgi:hypothetical protein
MSARITAATAARVLEQIRHDPRTIALLLVVPGALLWLLHEMLGDLAFDRLGRRCSGCSRSSRCSSSRRSRCCASARPGRWSA